MAASLPRFEDILEQVQAYKPDCDEELLRKAYVFSAMAHRGQVRVSGEPYLVHPLEVARILAELRLDEVAIVVGLLHDLLEDTFVSEEELARQFGSTVAGLVRALTKVASLEKSYAAREAAHAESFRRMLLASVEDIRVLLVKLADRLHNMRTLHYLDESKRRRIAQETLEIYAPLAHRLGMGKIKAELEDLAFVHLFPEEAERLRQVLEARRKKAEGAIQAIRQELERLLVENGIKGEVRFRIKHLYSVWRKLGLQNIPLEQLYDFLAFRVVVETTKTNLSEKERDNEERALCYTVLGLVHQRWQVVPGRFKDYIAVPKSNNYKSLHTCLWTEDGIPFEVQIRSRDMDEVAEKGVAAHWLYKEGRKQDADGERLAWLRSLLEGQQQNPRDFLESLKLDLYPEEVFCFTPKGEVVRLPKGATPVDFAYAIHTEVGNHCVGARVNGRQVPLRTVLKNGDMVEIQTSPNQVPRRDWLRFVASGRARSKIRAFLNREEKEKAKLLGRKLLEAEAKRLGLPLSEGLEDLNLKELAGAHGFAREEDLLAAVGWGKLSAREVLAGLIRQAPSEAGLLPGAEKPREAEGKACAVVEVGGDRTFLTYRAGCCKPLPGDPILGYLTRGRGVAIHRRSCSNLQRLLAVPERVVEAQWGPVDGQFAVSVFVRFEDRPGMLADISNLIRKAESNIRSCRLATEEGRGMVSLEVDVKNREHLEKLVASIRRLPGVTQVNAGSALSL